MQNYLRWSPPLSPFYIRKWSESSGNMPHSMTFSELVLISYFSQIIRVEEVEDDKCRRPHVKQFHDATIKFPLPHRANTIDMPQLSYRKPKTYFG